MDKIVLSEWMKEKVVLKISKKCKRSLLLFVSDMYILRIYILVDGRRPSGELRSE